MTAYTMAQLRGLPHDKAGLYGMPHLGAEYVGRGARSYRRTTGRCVVCGRPATNCHHVVPLSVGETFELRTPHGSHLLRPPLFALCGSGTTGCHDGFHGGSFLKARWVWDRPEYEEQWWDGLLLVGVAPHSPALFGLGHWEIENTRLGLTLSYGGGRSR